MRDSRDEEVQRYVRAGEHDNHSFLGWPGSNFFARAEHAHAALAEALVTEVRKRAPHAVVPDALIGLDLAAFTRAKAAPMVRGLFPRGEQQTVLDVLAQAVVFLTPDNISLSCDGLAGSRRPGTSRTCTSAASARSCSPRTHRRSSN